MKQNIIAAVALACMGAFLAYDYESDSECNVIEDKPVQVHYRPVKSLSDTCALKEDDDEWLSLTSDLSGWLKMDRLCAEFKGKGKLAW